MTWRFHKMATFLLVARHDDGTLFNAFILVRQAVEEAIRGRAGMESKLYWQVEESESRNMWNFSLVIYKKFIYQ